MQISNLKENMILKNYKQLCEVLEIPVATSNSKKAQFKELERYCEYHKEGNKIVIDTIYTEVKEKMDGRANNKGGRLNVKYVNDVEVLILHLLLGTNDDQKLDGVVGYSKSYLYSRLGLVNDNYKPTKNKVLQLSDVLNVPYQAINECYNTTNGKLWNTVRTGLNTLRNKALISWESGYNMVLSTDDEGYTYELKVANTYARNVIRDCERKALKKLVEDNKIDTPSKTRVFTCKRWNEFKELVTEYLQEDEYPNLIHYYESVVIHFNYLEILEEYKKLEHMDIRLVRETLNSNISVGLDNTIDSRHKNTKSKISNKDNVTGYDNYRVSERYTTEQKSIKNTIVNRDKNILIDFNFKHDGLKTLQLKYDWIRAYTGVDYDEEATKHFTKLEDLPTNDINNITDDSKDFEFKDDNYIPF